LTSWSGAPDGHRRSETPVGADVHQALEELNNTAHPRAFDDHEPQRSAGLIAEIIFRLKRWP